MIYTEKDDIETQGSSHWQAKRRVKELLPSLTRRYWSCQHTGCWWHHWCHPMDGATAPGPKPELMPLVPRPDIYAVNRLCPFPQPWTMVGCVPAWGQEGCECSGWNGESAQHVLSSESLSFMLPWPSWLLTLAHHSHLHDCFHRETVWRESSIFLEWISSTEWIRYGFMYVYNDVTVSIPLFPSFTHSRWPPILY